MKIEVEIGTLGGLLAELAAERIRQKNSEGWTPEHDDKHHSGELATAAACYAYVSPLSEHAREKIAGEGVPYRWPWDTSWWKPSNARRDLVKAGALIIAEIERLDRATITPASLPVPTKEERKI